MTTASASHLGAQTLHELQPEGIEVQATWDEASVEILTPDGSTEEEQFEEAVA